MLADPDRGAYRERTGHAGLECGGIGRGRPPVSPYRLLGTGQRVVVLAQPGQPYGEVGQREREVGQELARVARGQPPADLNGFFADGNGVLPASRCRKEDAAVVQCASEARLEPEAGFNQPPEDPGGLLGWDQRVLMPARSPQPSAEVGQGVGEAGFMRRGAGRSQPAPDPDRLFRRGQRLLRPAQFRQPDTEIG